MLRTPLEGTTLKPLRTLAVFLCLAFPTLSQDPNTTRLTDAAKTRGTAAFRTRRASAAELKAKDKKGMPPLMAAACGCSGETVRVLLENGADVNATDLVGCT